MKTLLVLLFSFLVSFAFSQNFVDLASVYYRMSPANSIEGSNNKMNFNTFAVDAKLPVPINDNTVAILALEYHKSTFSYVDIPNLDFDLSSFGIQMGVEHKWNDKFKTLAMVVTRYNTNYSDDNFGNNFQLGGVFLNKHQKNDNFTWKYGLYYNGELFAPMFVPLFGFIWQINDRTKLNITAPVNLEFSYIVNKKLRSGLRFDGVNGSYNLLSPGGTQLYVDRADNNVWLFNDLYITNNLVFHLKAGYSVLRNYRTFDAPDKMKIKMGPVNLGDNRIDTDKWFQNGWSFEARMIFRLPLD